MAAIKQILIFCLMVLIFENKSRFVHGLNVNFVEKILKFYQSISGGVKIGCNKTNIP